MWCVFVVFVICHFLVVFVAFCHFLGVFVTFWVLLSFVTFGHFLVVFVTFCHFYSLLLSFTLFSLYSPLSTHFPSSPFPFQDEIKRLVGVLIILNIMLAGAAFSRIQPEPNFPIRMVNGEKVRSDWSIITINSILNQSLINNMIYLDDYGCDLDDSLWI